MTIPDGWYIHDAPQHSPKIVKVYSGSAYDGDNCWQPKTPSHYYPIAEVLKEHRVIKITRSSSSSEARFTLRAPSGAEVTFTGSCCLQSPTVPKGTFVKGWYVHHNPGHAPRFVTYDGTCMKYKDEIFQARVPENYTLIPPIIVDEGLKWVTDFVVKTKRNNLYFYEKGDKRWLTQAQFSKETTYCSPSEVFLEGTFSQPSFEQHINRSKRITSTVTIE